TQPCSRESIRKPPKAASTKSSARRGCRAGWNYLQWLGIRPIHDEIRIYRKEPYFSSRQVGSLMAGVGELGEKYDLPTDDRFHAVGCFLAAFPCQVFPDSYEIACCLGS